MMTCFMEWLNYERALSLPCVKSVRIRTYSGPYFRF